MVWSLLVLLFAVPTLLAAFENAVHFDGLAIDGPFQLFNALRRIQAGYRPGVDFQFFHGMGVPYAHYWLYRLLGGGFGASELSRQLLGTAVYSVVFLIFLRAFSPDWKRALCLTAAGLAASWLLGFTAIMFATVGMLGLRSALPTLLPVALYVPETRRGRIVAAGLTLGASLLMGTEQAIAALLAYAVVMAVSTVRERSLGRAGEAASAIGLAFGTAAAWLLAVGGFAGMCGALRYNLSTVPQDQYWYFGVPPNAFIPSWSGFAMLFQVPSVGLAIIAAIGVSGWYLRRQWVDAVETESDASRRSAALATLPLYGLFSCGSLLGSLNIAYAAPLWRTLLLLALIELSRLSAAAHRRWLGVPRPLAAGAIALSGLTLIRQPVIVSTLTAVAVHAARDHLGARTGIRPEGIWPQTLRDGQAIIDAHRGPRGELPVLWSTYSGWIEARNGLFNPSLDYIIHSLGAENRRAYVDKFRATQPMLVQTVSPAYTSYESWIENNNWAFYDELLTWYDVAGTTPWSVYWERRATPSLPELVTTIDIPPGAPFVQLPMVQPPASGAGSLLEAEIEYQISNPLHMLPLIGASPRFLIGIGGTSNDTPVSLAPYEHVARFLVFASPGQRPSLHFQKFSLLPGVSFTPKVVRLYARSLDEHNQLWLTLMLRRSTQAPHG